MPTKMDNIFTKAQIPPKNENWYKLPDYKKNFGNEVEVLIADVLSKKGFIVEDVELGSKGSGIDDKIGKVDIWVKLEGIEDPLGIQYTISTNEKEIENKIKTLRENRWMAKKEIRGDSTIKWSGNANVVLVRGDKIKIAHYWEESQKKDVSFSDVIDDSFVGEIFQQIFKQLDEINPTKKDILMKVFNRAYRRAIKQKQ